MWWSWGFHLYHKVSEMWWKHPKHPENPLRAPLPKTLHKTSKWHETPPTVDVDRKHMDEVGISVHKSWEDKTSTVDYCSAIFQITNNANGTTPFCKTVTRGRGRTPSWNSNLSNTKLQPKIVKPQVVEPQAGTPCCRTPSCPVKHKLHTTTAVVSASRSPTADERQRTWWEGEDNNHLWVERSHHIAAVWPFGQLDNAVKIVLDDVVIVHEANHRGNAFRSTIDQRIGQTTSENWQVVHV